MFLKKELSDEEFIEIYRRTIEHAFIECSIEYSCTCNKKMETLRYETSKKKRDRVLRLLNQINSPDWGYCIQIDRNDIVITKR